MASETLATQFPDYGRCLRKHFAFDPDFIPLNHGGLGATPRAVLDASNDLTLEIESNPDDFVWLRYESKLNEVRRQIARLVNVDMDECVLVPNVCNGINTVLRNIEWREGDVIIITNCTFNPIANAARHISQTYPFPAVIQFPLNFPESREDLLVRWRKFLRGSASPLASSGSSQRRVVAIIDSIVSGPGLVMPWREMVQTCKEGGVWTVIDAAHSLGQERVDLSATQPDFWVSTTSKWLFARRGCAVLYVPKRNQHMIKTSLPTAFHAPFSPDTSTFGSRFAWFGSLDLTIALSIPAALRFKESLGGEKRMNAYCRMLALAGGKRLADILGTREMDQSPGRAFTANMVLVELPLPADVVFSFETMRFFQIRLIEQHKVYASQTFHNGKWWTRASAAVYNDVSDFEKLGYALVEVCREIAKRPRTGARL